MEERNHPTEPSVENLDMWLEFQAGQLGTPTWWEELGAILGIEDQHKFTQRIWVLFCVLEVQLRACPEQGYVVPLACQILNRSVFLPERLAYQDVRQQPALLTIAYCQCLQHWVEKHNPPKNPDFHPLAESVRELRQAMQEFVSITPEDILKDLKIEETGTSFQQSLMTIFSWVLDTLADRQEAVRPSPHSEDRAMWCALHPQGLNRMTTTC